MKNPIFTLITAAAGMIAMITSCTTATPTDLTINSGSTLSLNGDVTAQNFSSATGTDIAGPHNLTITGDAVFGGAVGSGTALASLSVSGTSAINARYPEM